MYVLLVPVLLERAWELGSYPGSWAAYIQILTERTWQPSISKPIQSEGPVFIFAFQDFLSFFACLLLQG